MKIKLAGIDYGSKLAGTTAICIGSSPGRHKIIQSEKKKDADKFILDNIKQLQPDLVAIDAPLSLPGVYFQPQTFRDFFYREGDKELKAMSPMFLGGLTARAMKLKYELAKLNIAPIEVYPAALAREFTLDQQGYKKSDKALDQCLLSLKQQTELKIGKKSVTNWHQFDSVLAWCSGWRYLQQQFEIYGHEEEGQIIV